MSTVSVEGPLHDPARLGEVEHLWFALYEHNRAVANYARLLDDLNPSWDIRRSWYERLLALGGALFLASADSDPIAYAMLHTTRGSDDLGLPGGVVEIVSLAVGEHARGVGIGSALLDAVRDYAAALSIDTIMVSVMTGNDRALTFYTNRGFCTGEIMLYLKPAPKAGALRRSLASGGT